MKCPRINMLKRGSARSPRYECRYTVAGKRYHDKCGGARTLEEYKAFVHSLARRFELGTWAPPTQGSDSLLFKDYVLEANAKRVALGVISAERNELSIINTHLIPEFGDETLEELCEFSRVVEGFARIAQKDVGGATMRNIHLVFRATMRLAAKAAKIRTPPPPLTVRDGELPAVIERRPDGWREAALFTRDEITQLLRCDAVEMQYAVMYVTYFMTGSRFAEVTPLRVRNFDPDCQPLASLVIRANKQPRQRRGVAMYRIVPVHPILRAWLSWWLRVGFPAVHKRPAAPDDLVFPAFTERRVKAARRTGIDPRELPCSHPEIYNKWRTKHLPAAGLRHRRLHDARRTFLSILRSSGANKEIARSFTHRAIADQVLDAYTTYEWDALCRELTKVEWRLPGPPFSTATVVELRTRQSEA